VAHSGTRVFAVWTVLVVCLQGLLFARPEDYEGKPVAEILFDPALQPFPDAELYDMLPVKTGEPLRIANVRDAIERLYATGRYKDVAADAELRDGEVILEFQTRGTWFIGRVAVEGVPEPPNKGQLVNAANLQLGTEYDETQVQQGLENIRRVLRDNGFYEARVERFLDYEPSFSQVNILFLVEPGPRASFARPVVNGVPPESVDKVIDATGWKSIWGLFGWKSVTDTRVQRGLERVRESYQKRNYLLSRVTLEDIRYDARDNIALPILKVEQGPRVRIQVTGAKLSDGKRKELIPIYQEQSVDRDLLIEGMRNLTEYFQSEGYFDAKVTFNTKNETNGPQTIEYVIDRGERHKLVQLEIEGNHYFDTETIRERMNIMPATFLRYRHGRFSEALLENDVEAITNLYHSNGFREVKVTNKVETDYRGNKTDIAVVIQIDEGPQWRVGKLALTGVSKENELRVEALMDTGEGQPYSETNMAIERDNVLNYYYNNGYPDASFTWRSKPGDEPHTTDVQVTVEEGPRRFVRAALVGGLVESDPEMVYNRIELGPGDPLSQSSMVDSQRRLYDLGIFARVNMAVQNPDGQERSKYILNQFEEARRYSLSVGGGAEIARIGGGVTNFDAPAGAPGFSPRFSFGISRSNMFGIGHTASIQTRLSNIQRRAVLTYLAPQFKGNEDVNLSFTGLYDFSRDIRTFAGTREEGTAQIGQRISRANSMQYRVTYRRVTVDESTLKISPELIPVFSQPVRVGLISASFIQDRRDDPIESTRGFYNTIDLGVASKIFASQTDYVRLLGRNSTYHQLGHNLVLARSLTFGWLLNTGTKEIPLPERFFSGGATTHRGFPDNQAGPRDLETGFPIGGDALLMSNIELRFPLLGDHLGGVLFHDAGNVYSRLENLSFRFRQRDKTDFDYAVQAFGFGVRYRTPIGPVRLDLAFSPNSPRFFGFKGTQQDLLEGRGTKTDQRINQFQFHFSLGQTF
jgi:outer membrane protein insertion porin family